MSKEQLQRRRAEMLSALDQMLEQRKALDAQIGWHQGGIMMLEELLQGVEAPANGVAGEVGPAGAK